MGQVAAGGRSMTRILAPTAILWLPLFAPEAPPPPPAARLITPDSPTKNPVVSAPDEKIWNGADDNGSGTVTVLEIARAFMEGKLRTKRSILFMLFSGEEFGLIGSQYYVDHPLFPLEKTAAMINLDMVGRPGKRKLDVGGTSTAKEWPDLLAKAAEGT